MCFDGCTLQQANAKQKELRAEIDRLHDLLGKANALAKIRMNRIGELTNVLQAFSDYVTDEQMSTDGAVSYSTTSINHWAFLARQAIHPVLSLQEGVEQ